MLHLWYMSMMPHLLKSVYKRITLSPKVNFENRFWHCGTSAVAYCSVAYRFI